jgi:hypothetical protein
VGCGTEDWEVQGFGVVDEDEMKVLRVVSSSKDGKTENFVETRHGMNLKGASVQLSRPSLTLALTYA